MTKKLMAFASGYLLSVAVLQLLFDFYLGIAKLGTLLLKFKIKGHHSSIGIDERTHYKIPVELRMAQCLKPFCGKQNR